MFTKKLTTLKLLNNNLKIKNYNNKIINRQLYNSYDSKINDPSSTILQQQQQQQQQQKKIEKNFIKKLYPINSKNNNYDYDTIRTELDDQLQQVKIFSDENIIQFTFKSGKSVNFTMHWLRNLCDCPECINKKFVQNFSNVADNNNNNFNDNFNSSSKFYDDKKSSSLNITHIKCFSDSNKFEIEWLDEDYHKHTSIYDVKNLNLYYKHNY